MMEYSLRKAYQVARVCSPISNHEGFNVEPCEDYWKIVEAGVEAGILID
jgi:hypothetical protein